MQLVERRKKKTTTTQKKIAPGATIGGGEKNANVFIHSLKKKHSEVIVNCHFVLINVEGWARSV